MATTVQFVDSIASSPTVRLDLNDTTRASGWLVSVSGFDMSPPPMRRSVISTMLRDGEPIAAAAYSNRTLTIPLTYVGAATATAAALALQALATELNRPTNILKVQFGSFPVFFKTYRAPDYSLTMQRLTLQQNNLTLEIQAEPFASGLAETPSGSPYTVTNNPAAGSNGQFFDVTGVKGDVETPLRLTVPGADLDGHTAVIAVRRRGTPSATPFVIQAETMTIDDGEATLPGNDALMSGAGSNYVRHPFVITPGASSRLDVLAHPAAASVDARGTYRVFVRMRHSVGSAVIKLQVSTGNVSGVVTTTTPLTTMPLNTTLQLVDLGLVSIPGGAAPTLDGDGTELSVVGARIIISGERTSGTGNLDVDYFLFVPADDRLAVVSLINGGTPPNRYRIDSAQESVFGISAAGAVETTAGASVAGGLPYVSPGVTNRVYFIEDLIAAVSATAVITAVYWPRYLVVPGS